MSREVDLDLINTKVRHRENLVHDGKFIEASKQEGRTPESIIKEAKDILGIGEDALIMLEYEEVLAKQNKRTKAFVSLTNFIVKAKETDMLEESEELALDAIESRLAKSISELYDIDIDDLYTKGDL